MAIPGKRGICARGSEVDFNDKVALVEKGKARNFECSSRHGLNYMVN